MAMSGFICHDDYYDRLKRLSDEEVGHLFRMLMLYHAGRTEEMESIGFVDSEGIAFDFIASDIDRMEEKQNATSETNRRNGMKGGRPKKQTEPEETEENRQKPTETEAKPIKGYKDKDKDKEKDKDKDISSSSFIADDDARMIQTDQNRVLDAAEDAGFKMSNDVRASLINLYADYGVEKVLDAMKACVKHGATNLAYLEAVLKGKPKQKKPAVIAQDYDQRDYSDIDKELMEEQEREMEEFMKGAG